MTMGLFTLEDSLVTKYVNVTPRKDIFKIENRLLDGSFHFQTVGAPHEILDVIVYATYNQRGTINDLMVNCTPVKIVEEATWFGIIQGIPTWIRLAGKQAYELTLTVAVIPEGDL